MTEERRSHLVIGTAGHIDHGKTTLVKALTGTDTDRLREEKERGITIELGFAFYGDHAAFVDVPGHERLVKTMVAGAAAMRAALLVVAADDGVMPQTREHLAVLDALGVSRGIVAITKADLATDADWLDLVAEEIREILKPTTLSGSPIIVTDALSGRGIDELRGALDRMIGEFEQPEDPGFFRLPIDRSFLMKGHGRVVTGTVWSGRAKPGDRLTLLPQNVEVRVRALQAHEKDVDQVQPGDRAALNLQTESEPQRGNQLNSVGRGVVTEFLDAELRLLPDARSVEHRQRVRLHLGTDETIGRLLIVGGDIIEPGVSGFVRIALEVPVAAMHGDRGVLRLYSPLEMLGGVRVLDPDPPDRRRTIRGLRERLGQLANADEQVIPGLLKSRSVMTLADLCARLPWLENRIADVVRAGVAGGGLIAPSDSLEWVTLASHWRDLVQKTVAVLQDYHDSHPDKPGLPRGEWIAKLFGEDPGVLVEHLIAVMTREEMLRYENGRLIAEGHRVSLKPSDEKDAKRVEEILLREGINAPLPATIAEELGLTLERVRSLLRSLKQVGRVVILAENVVVAQGACDEAKEQLRKAFGDGSEFSAGSAAKALGTTRKYIIPLLEAFDRDGVTVRAGDTRRVRK
ncbi:MAG: selenocysteine-specific translation elongation factor [bacterium]